MIPEVRHVYVHFPYCLHRCAYCDFATTKAAVIPRQRYLRAVLTELDLRAEQVQFAHLESVFFGGGTPSLWGPAAIAAVLEALHQRAGFVARPEITLEANPGALESGDLLAYTVAGINRVSIGVQALQDDRLRALDRLHDAAAARHTLGEIAALLATARLHSASADLIFGGPGQTLADLADDVRGVLDCGLPHLSAYSLTVERGTPLAAQVARGQTPRPDDDLQAAMLEALPDLVAPYGLGRYEVSNYAVPGHASRHNLAYWTGRYYLALGVGAHGFLPSPPHLGVRYGNARQPAAWLAALGRNALGEAFREPISAAQHTDERLLTGLRLTDGLDLTALAADVGAAATVQLTQRAARALARGDLWLRADHLGVQPTALSRLDSVIRELA